MNAEAFLARLQHNRHYRGQIAGVRVLEARAAALRAPLAPLPPAAQAVLRGEGIDALYSHQADAYDAVVAGHDVVICTGTASGKSLCYHLPVLAALAEDPESRALHLFPAKALAYDQLAGLEDVVSRAGLDDRVRPACYDGDTPTHKRPGIRRTANVLLSNPDMLHISILPYHAKWAAFLSRLRFVVLDEVHTYRGIFGSHVSGVLRRLQRLCGHYAARPQFICCSATLANPRELAERLTGREMTLIDRDGSPRGRKWFVLWNPPWLDAEGRAAAPGERSRQDRPSGAPTAGGGLVLRGPTPSHPSYASSRPAALKIARRSGNVEAQELMRALLEDGAGTITFCKARVVAELIYTYVVDSLRRKRPDLVGRVRPYRGGYLPLERREIEQKLFSGELLGVCSTNALELGIDVGSLDAAIIVGFPGTLCSLWQQAGRAGRRQEDSLAIFIAYDDPVDQYLMREPGFVFEKPLEQAVIDPDNPHILAAQLACAAFELPLTSDDLPRFSSLGPDVAAALRQSGSLRRTGERDYWASSEFPAARTSLRTISNATFSIVDATDGRNAVIGQVDAISAPELVYPEAVYLHQGESYLVRELDWAARLARVERLDADYYTQPVLADACELGQERLSGGVCGGVRRFGDVTVRWQTIAFRKFKLFTQELIGQTMLDLPAQQVQTVGAWFTPPAAALETTRAAGHKLHEALAGVRNLMMVALPPLAMCDRYDIGGVVNASQLGVSTIILYDRYAGGVGYARHAYEHADRLLKLARELVAGCDCEHGCPGCVAPPNLRIAIHHDPDLAHGGAIPDKAATRALLSAWLAAGS
jgi:DEAD/DEAH box helicase domain-containing protein